MRIHRLSFAGLGPFAGEHSIDFDVLGDGALFIIEGPTGAGKSTIVDALVFALYGDVAGRDSDRQRLRSDFADAGDPSFAEVEFSTSRGLYRVRRTPEFARPKRRGEGTTSERPTTQVWQSTSPGHWEAISTRHQEADIEIYRIIGLDKAQFQQTVVLPQGQFAEFLHARSADRQVILEKIFSTGMYREIQQFCDQARKDVEQRLDVASRDVREAADRLISRVSEDIPEAVVDWQESLLSLATEPEDAAELLAHVDELATESVTVAQHGRALVSSTSDTMQRQQQALDRLHQARVVQQELQKATSALDGARTAVQTASTELRATLSAYPGLGLTDQNNATTIVEEVERQRAGLLHLSERVAAEPALRDQHARLQRDAQRANQALHRLLDERSTAIPNQLAAIIARLQQATIQADQVATAAQLAEQETLQGRLAGMAATLAETLQEGSACPVCGAVEHPAPADPAAQQVTVDQLDQAGHDRQQAQEIAGRLRADLQAASTVAIGIELPPETVATESAEPRQLAVIQQRLSQIDTERAAVLAQSTQLQAEAERAALELRTLAEECHQAVQPFDTLADRLTALQQVRSQAQLVSQARANETAAAERHAQAVQAVSQAPPDASDEIMQRVSAAVDQAVREHAAAVSSADQMQRLADALAVLCADLHHAWDALVDLRQQSTAVIRLADVLNGRAPNSLQQPLATFVVQQMFEEVVAAANHRLQTMLGGRFALVSTEEAAGRERLHGLGLAVRDLATEAVRKPQTLSGGETFCASLALALGLADTVRANAGGVEIGMLIVDEGFGSLDSARPDDVMSELKRLQAGGRTLGVISP
ncbi:MAG: AAA family ATPase, partial [Actinomycetales bacterium]